ncbi:MAG: pyridoxamine 5'-phosphate oxidase family protein [Firmicutes bacterium]|nr:pyridoxamine 5'-phosphate oxidase family protein [Bacillota bacterium]
MYEFEIKCREFFKQIGNHNTMVLSTSLNDKVTSRMMSIIVIDGKFYFQTDNTFRKYQQIQGNPNVALCADNIQIEGVCNEVGRPQLSPEFCKLYNENFSVSYKLYSELENERLFEIIPTYIQKWIYVDGKPFIGAFDFKNKIYTKQAYI